MAAFIVIMLTGALVGPIFAPTQEETPVLRMIWPPIYALVLALSVRRIREMAQLWPAALIMLVLLGFAFASRWWSIDPETTGRRTIALGITMLFGLYLAAGWPGVRLARLLVIAGVVMAIGSLIMIAAFPAYGIHADVNAGLWRGLWYEKNQMGLVMVAVAIAAMALLMAQEPSPRPMRWLAMGLLPVTGALVVATQSKTSLLCMVLGLGLIIGFWLLRRIGPALAVVGVWIGVSLGALGLLMLFTEAEIILSLLGKDPTLTGRTDIWEALMRQVDARPMTGYGYAAFWGLDSVPARFIRHETGWLVPSAHNGWLEVLVQIGWPGTIAVGIAVVLAGLATMARLPGSGAREGFWGAAYLAVFFLLSLSESVLMLHHNLSWVLFIAILARGFAPTAAIQTAPEHNRSHRLPTGLHPGRASPTKPVRESHQYRRHGQSFRPSPVRHSR